MAETEDRTEAASARRLQKAREEGGAPISREATTLGVLGAGTLVLAMAAPGIARTLAARLAALLAGSGRLDPSAGLRAAALALLAATAPFVLAALLAGSLAVLLQSGFALHTHALRPDVARLDPRRGLARIVSTRALFEALKSLVKLAVVAAAGWQVFRAMPGRLEALLGEPVGALALSLRGEVLALVMAMLAAQALIAVLDLVQTRLQHMRGLRMSRQELRDEHKEMEGDPQIKGRIRQIRQQRMRRRMILAVPKATVVLTNPTHYAVALAYDPAAPAAPRVVAKGVDEVAARIREVAQANAVPLVANPPLARALYLVPLEAEIPAEHFKLVAEIIAYVWRLRGKAATMAA
ncbi:MAG: EscU/YscU/HrcU family type III secretion system export apparatus switch protein [Rhodospirillales bacterium]|nr:EscU/YscU/HrcU family type III secretion system export apparatus switch protein [Rhodospirillales bacterium]MDE2574735.1 EscU/YscU/HrcU family type III secretion system export apparatus switch protein [Rhodospirillales bacterium]